MHSDSRKMKSYLNNPRILGLGEVMDAVSVINGSVSMHENWDCFRIVSGTDMRRFWKRENWQLMRWRELQRIMSVWTMNMLWRNAETVCRC